MERILMMLAMSMLVGCVPSIQEIRQTEPIAAERFHGNYQEIAFCSIGSMEQNADSLTYRLLENPKERTAVLTATLVWIYARPVFELTFHQTQSEVVIEFREKWVNLWGSTHHEHVWPLVERCAQKSP